MQWTHYPEHREVLVLRDLMDMPYRDIANTLNVNEGTIKSELTAQGKT